ncbi:MAG: Cof-type HAD-IIB family hydrolase [Spirochaetaceae bacterium]|nr:Cof-type HAD-IIB family hydrolase [Spirochaetaceae bacterium]
MALSILADMELQKDKVKALVMDLDGTTLAADAVLTERTRKALRGCIAKGLRVIIATGRSTDAAEAYRAAIGAEGPMVYYNGSVVMDMPSRTIIDSHYIGQDVISGCVDIAHAENTHFHVFLRKKDAPFTEMLAAENPSEAAARYSSDFFYRDLYSILSVGDYNCIKGIFIDREPKLQRIRKIVEESLRGKVTITLSADFILEILASGVSKASGMRAALEFCGLTPSEVIAFGDEENDISMLSLAAYSVAPSNARQSVRETASMVIGPNTGDSIAAFLEETFL